MQSSSAIKSSSLNSPTGDTKTFVRRSSPYLAFKYASSSFIMPKIFLGDFNNSSSSEIIRFFYHRPRPFITLQVNQLLSENEWSFPSGHSAFFFAMAAAIYFYNKKWGIGFFIAAILMNISRIIAGVHYPTDILSGAIIGGATAYIVFYFAAKKIAQKV